MGIVSNIRADLERSAAELLREYWDRLVVEAQRLCGDESAAEDLVMRTFERYLFNRSSYDPQRGSLLVWLRTVMRNLHTDSLRKRKVGEVLMSLEEIERAVDGQGLAVPEEDPEQKAREERLVCEAVDSLSPKLRAAVVLHYFEKLPLKEVARTLCVSEDSVKQRLYYARKVLAKRLGKMMGRAALAIAAVLFGGSLVYAAAVAVGLAPSLFTAAEPAAEAAPAESTEVSEGSLTGLSANQESQTTGANGDSPQVVAEVTDNFNTNKEENAMNGSIVKKSAAKLVAAAAVLCGASAALAASTNEFAVIDIMETVRQSEVASPFTVSYTGAHSASDSLSAVMQLFDGDLTADNTKADSENGRVLFVLSKGATVTVSFNPAAFGNRPLFLGQYGFRMANVTTAGGWQIPNRLPAAWTVKVSDKENPSSDDDWVLVDSHSGLTYSFYGPVNGCYTADFSLELPVAFRHVRFAFTGSTGNDDNVQLGEICMSGLIGPNEAGRRDVCLYKTSPVSPNADGSATAKASILPAGAEVDPYDIFVTCRTGDHADTNWLARATQFTGLYETTIPGLRLGSDYTLQFGTVAANGTVELGEVVEFSTPLDIMPAGVLPAGYTELEYIESTDTGHQYIDCGFAPSDVVLGFDLDFIGYNEFMRGAYHDTDNRKTGYGVYLSSTVKGQNAQVLVSSSTGGSGGYPDGLFVYDGVAMNARLTKGERMSVLLGNGKYTTICGAVTNAQNKTRLRITGPTLSLFASENGPGNDPDQFAAMRLYSLKVYDDTVARTLTHEFVPAKRQSDNAIGVYDVVANAWRPNGSATPFLAGPAVVGGDILTIGSVSFVGRTLTVTLNRNGASTAEADVYALWGGGLRRDGHGRLGAHGAARRVCGKRPDGEVHDAGPCARHRLRPLLHGGRQVVRDHLSPRPTRQIQRVHLYRALGSKGSDPSVYVFTV